MINSRLVLKIVVSLCFAYTFIQFIENEESILESNFVVRMIPSITNSQKKEFLFHNPEDISLLKTGSKSENDKRNINEIEQFFKNIHGFVMNIPIVRNVHDNINKNIQLRQKQKSLRNQERGASPVSLSSNQITTLMKHNQDLRSNVYEAVSNEEIWTKVNEQDNVTVWKMDSDYEIIDCASSSDSITIKSESMLPYSPHLVFSLLQDENKVHEYNENCQALEHIASLKDGSKINWSATGKFGPFSARDFVTLVRYEGMGKDASEGYLGLASSFDTIREQNYILFEKESNNTAYNPFNERPGYVRSRIELAATFIMPVKGDPYSTRFQQVIRVGNLGGAADSPIAKRIKSSLEIQAPIDFVKKFSRALGNYEIHSK